MKIFILEDSLKRVEEFKKRLIGHELVIAYNGGMGKELFLVEGPFDFIFLDHDLEFSHYIDPNDPGLTGAEFCRWAVKEHLDMLNNSGDVIIHSLNEQGRLNMCNILKGAGKEGVSILPFLWEEHWWSKAKELRLLEGLI